jgi:hypothetical protein
MCYLHSRRFAELSDLFLTSVGADNSILIFIVYLYFPSSSQKNLRFYRFRKHTNFPIYISGFKSSSFNINCWVLFHCFLVLIIVGLLLAVMLDLIQRETLGRLCGCQGMYELHRKKFFQIVFCLYIKLQIKLDCRKSILKK